MPFCQYVNEQRGCAHGLWGMGIRADTSGEVFAHREEVDKDDNDNDGAWQYERIKVNYEDYI